MHKLSQPQFVSRASTKHNSLYDYSKSEYVASNIKLIITCPLHGDFLQQPNSHLSGKGCPTCGRNKCDTNRKLTQDEFVTRSRVLHNNKYTYNNTKYIHHARSVIITCPIHGDFNQIAYTHLRGCGCQLCAKTKHSRPAINWLTAISEQEGIEIQHAENIGEFSIPGTRYKADGYCKETNTIYEFYGDKFHGNPDKFQEDDRCHPYESTPAGELYKYTLDRENTIRSKGFNLISMWENDYVV